MSRLPSFARFWMVCRKPDRPGARTEPRQRYSHLQDARDAAAQLAAENDAPFVILEAIEVVWPGVTPQEAPL